MRTLCGSAIGATLLLAGCQAPGPRSSTEPPPVKMLGSNWALVSLAGELPAGESKITLEFGADGKVGGDAGVNRYFGPYQIAHPDSGAGALSFGEIGSARMAGSPELMKQESEYLDLLRAVDAYRAGGGLLELNGGGRPLLRYRQIARQP